jgi:hypothetical protein
MGEVFGAIGTSHEEIVSLRACSSPLLPFSKAMAFVNQKAAMGVAKTHGLASED